MKQDAIYARQSVEREDSLSIEGQLARCRFETRDGAREYIDRGFSGKNTNRPAFRRMMDDIRAGEIGKVIVYRLDRISRSILDFAQMMELFAEKGVEFLSSTEHFDT
ncbi:MAG: recombinase family protein, partial [Butyricicoccus sp.]